MSDIRLCSVCHAQAAKYTCPACGRKTCGINCVNRHKSQYDCSGKIDPSKFIPKQSISEDSVHLKRDYNFLVDFERNIHVKKADIKANARNLFKKPVQTGTNKRFKKDTTNDVRMEKVTRVFPHEPQTVVKRQNTMVVQVPQGMSRSLSNKSGYDKKLGTFVWTVEWILLDRDGMEVLRFLSYRLKELLILDESVPLNILSQQQFEFEKSSLRFYLDNVLSNTKQEKSVIELVNLVSLAENLKDKVVLEYPTIFVTTSSDTLSENVVSTAAAYCISDSDESDTDLSDDTSNSDTSSDGSSDDSDLEDEPEQQVEQKHTESTIEATEKEDQDISVQQSVSIAPQGELSAPESSTQNENTNTVTNSGNEIGTNKETEEENQNLDSSDEAPEEESAKLPTFTHSN